MDAVNILWDKLLSMWVGLVRLLPNFAIAVLVLIVTWAAAKLARRGAERIVARAGLRPRLRDLLRTLLTIAVWMVGIMISATILIPSLTPAGIIAGLGIGTVAIGFAFQDIFENFLAGILIMLRQKMRIGDVIECKDISGRVEQISLRETHVRQLSNELTVVPNSVLFKNPVKVVTEQPMRRHHVVVGVSYDSDLDQAAQVIETAVRGADTVAESKPVEVYATEFGASSINFTVRWWSGAKPVEMYASRDRVVRAIKRALDEAGIEIPFPYVTNTYKEPLTIIGAAQPDKEQQ